MNLDLAILDGVTELNLEGDSLISQSLHKDLSALSRAVKEAAHAKNRLDYGPPQTLFKIFY